MNFLLEINYKAAEILAKFGYSKFLSEEYGIDCKNTNKEDLDKVMLEFDYKLDKNICNADSAK